MPPVSILVTVESGKAFLSKEPLALGLIAVLATGWLGGELVYRWGVAVQAVR